MVATPQNYEKIESKERKEGVNGESNS